MLHPKMLDFGGCFNCLLRSFLRPFVQFLQGFLLFVGVWPRRFYANFSPPQMIFTFCVTRVLVDNDDLTTISMYLFYGKLGDIELTTKKKTNRG